MKFKSTLLYHTLRRLVYHYVKYAQLIDCIKINFMKMVHVTILVHPSAQKMDPLLMQATLPDDHPQGRL